MQQGCMVWCVPLDSNHGRHTLILAWVILLIVAGSLLNTLVQREGVLKQQGWMVLHNLGYVDACILCCKPHSHQTSCQLTHVSSQ